MEREAPRREVERRGAYIVPDANGHLPNAAAGSRLASPWREAVAALVGRYRARLGAGLHSVYVRGSVASGGATCGVSDLDSFAVLAPGASPDLDPSAFDEWARSTSRSLTREHPCVTDVEIDLVPCEKVTRGRGYYAFALKTVATRVYGEDLAAGIAPFRLGYETAFQARYFRKHLEIFRREYPSEPAHEQPAFTSWLARRFVRLGMELVMEKEGRYSNDLYPCYESFAKHHPERAEEMWRALELAVDPVGQLEGEEFLLEFGAWLAAQADAALLRWGRSPAGA